MAHPRQLIREAVTALLTAAGTAAGARVYETRMKPHRRTELPALAVYTLEESVDGDEDSAPRELTRTLQLAVEGAVKASEDVDDALDDLALEVETAMHADDTFGGTAADSILASTEIDIQEDGDRTVGLVRLIYTVTYYTYATAPAPTDDFRTADVRYDLAGAVHADNEAHDVVEIPEE